MTQVSCRLAPLFEDQAAEVAAQAGAGADIAAGADDDVADQHGRGMDVGGRVDDRDDAVKGGCQMRDPVRGSGCGFGLMMRRVACRCPIKNWRPEAMPPYLATLHHWCRSLTLLFLSLLAISPAAADPPGRVGRIASLFGSVHLHRAESGESSAAVLNWPLTSGDVLSTAAGARAEVQIGSNLLQIASGSVLELVRRPPFLCSRQFT
jgi:hypothetical protein